MRQLQLVAFGEPSEVMSLMPGDWIGQTAANSAMGQYIIALAKLAGVKTLNVVRREEAAEQVRQWGGDRIVQQGDNLHKYLIYATYRKICIAYTFLVLSAPLRE